ncbi:phage portal protein [Paracoccus yeei]|uniref:Phage portal protein n=1 Tax=Paracoccus yeei TaxID=147645 RepID=A0A386UIC9_9RHOB|nr:phage portal protein [Paracoccus yeei]
MGGILVTTKAKAPATQRNRKTAPPARMEYMGHDRAGIIHMRRAVTRDIKHDVLAAADRAFALAFDFMQNSGWISGAADQIISDMIGTELKLNARPDLSRLGYSDAERAAWCRLVENDWRRWSWTPRECDIEGRATVQEMLDGAARYYLAGGEALAVLDYMTPAVRQRYGVRSGVKARLVSPHRLSRYTSLVEGWDQGIYHDENGRPTHYRFRVVEGGLEQDLDLPVMAGAIQRIIHTMDRGTTPNSPRGISPMTPAFKVIAQSDQLADATLTTALLQTAFAATITSPEPSDTAFQALQAVAEMEGDEGFEGAQDLAADLLAVWQQRIESLKSKRLSIGGDASQVNHLGPGEKLELHTAQAGGAHYEAFQRNLLREVARCLGVTVESLTMDHSSASYSSSRMAVASVWPTVVRRRERIVAPVAQGIYEAWLDEAIAEGRIPFKGGYRAFAANRDLVVDAEWRGPARPSADPYKDALAEKVRLESGTMTLQEVWAERGLDWEEGLDQIGREQDRFEEIGVRSPFGRSTGGGAGPQGAATEGTRDPANAD